MSRALKIATIAAFCASPAMAEDDQGGNHPSIYFSFEGMSLERVGGDALIYHDDDDNRREYTIRDLLGADLTYGGRFTLGGTSDANWGVELGGIFADGFGGYHVDVDDGNDYDAAYENDVDGELAFSSSDSFEGIELFEYASLTGLEASATYAFGDARVFVGPRWIRYQSQLITRVYDDTNDYEGNDDETDIVDISSLNDLLGVHFGVDGMYDLNDSIRIGGRASLGVYANGATLSRYIEVGDGRTPFVSDVQEAVSSASGFAHSVELSPRIEFAASENLTLSLGGTLLWLNGVDNPGDHYSRMGADNGLGTLADDTPNLSGDVKFSGLTVGLHGQF